MLGSESEPPRRSLAFRVFILVSIIVIFTYALWHFILPLFWKYEKLEIFSHYWMANSQGEVKQLVIVFKNNGSQESTLEEVWFDGVLVNSADWESWSGERTLEPKFTNTFYIVPEGLTFEKRQDYNLTIVTARKDRFNFTLNVNEDNIKTEKVKINQCYFYRWPPGSHDKFIGIEVKSFGNIVVIIKEVFIDGASFSVSPRLWLDNFHSTDDIEISFPWKEGSTYTITIETVAGSTYEITATAD